MPSETLSKKPEIALIYDGECPACSAFSRIVRIRKSVGEIRLIDARESSEVMDEITDLGLDIDQGMVLKIDEQLYYGSDAMHRLALLGSRSGIFNRFNHWIFKSQRRSAALYPMLRACRDLLLKILGKHKINNLTIPGGDKF